MGKITHFPTHPKPPKGLSRHEATLWRDIVAEYPVGYFKTSHLLLLEQFCRARAFVKLCDDEITRNGLVVDGKANPAVKMRNAGWAEVRACATKLRLAISSSQRANATPTPVTPLRKPWE